MDRPIGTEVAVLNSQVVPCSQVVLKKGFTVVYSTGVCTFWSSNTLLNPGDIIL